jgi:hypothetical protein
MAPYIMKKLAAVMVFMTGVGLVVRGQNGDTVLHSGNTDTILEISATAVSGVRPDTVPRIDWQHAASFKPSFPIKSFIIPATLIAYGFVALNSGELKNFNRHIKEEIWTENPHKTLSLDNYLMFAPAAVVYGLNAAGIHGKNNFRDRSMIFVMSSILADGSVFVLKGWTHQLRPDGSAYTSFPSGHTAQAFASAEFMRMEYKDVSFWYGVAGYAMAAATGYLRLYNNKHWVSDVVTGAGIGIASTKLAYWLYPYVKHVLWKDKTTGPIVMPTYQNGAVGLAFVRTF